MRVVFDVNFLIRVALRSRSTAHLLRISLESGVTILTCVDFRDEFADIARKPRLRERIDWEIHNQILATLETSAEPVTIQRPYPPCRDPDDAYLLAMATIGQADYLVTFDLDLLCIESVGTCRIIRPEEFAAVLGIAD